MPVIRRAFIFVINCLGALALLGSPTPLAAQRLFAGGSAGVAVPVLGISDFRTAGPLLTGSVGYDSKGGRWAVRADFSWIRFPGEQPPEDRQSSIYYGDMHARGISLNLISRFPGLVGAIKPYLLTGIGQHDLKIESLGRSSYGWVWGGTFGLGSEWEIGSGRLFAEVPLTIMLSDYGSRDGFVLDSYLPLAIGLRF